MPADISRTNNANYNRRSNATRIHRGVITRVVEDGLYEFTIPEFDPVVRFGPSPGNLGLLVNNEPFAVPTVDNEWFLILPQMLGAEGGGGGPETDPIAGPALAAHELETTGVHGIADTSVLVTDSDLNDHAADTTNIHGIVDTAALDTITARNNAIALHDADTSVHGIADTTALATDAEVASAVATHSADTTAVHGIADTSLVMEAGDAAGGDLAGTYPNPTVKAIKRAIVRRNANFTVANNAITFVPFDTEVEDNDVMYTAGNNFVTIKTAGLYRVTAQFGWPAAVMQRVLVAIFYTPSGGAGVALAADERSTPGTDGVLQNISVEQTCGVNDIWQVFMYQFHATAPATRTIVPANYHPRMSVTRIGG